MYDLENLQNEIWKPISGFEGLYEISNYGRVKSLGNGIYNSKKKILIPWKENCGYLRILLSKNGTHKHYSVHRLVATTFLPNPENLPQVNHRDEDKQNNHVDNLEWCSSKYNINYGTAIDRRVKKQINHKKLSKPVLQYDLKGNFIAEYPSLSEVQRKFGFLQGNISSCCLGKLKSAYGYIWKFKY